ncbi:MAG: hypothetical protein ACKVQS_14205 [Fimbriimonadaceae bacterium]
MSRKFHFTASSVSMLLAGTVVALIAIVSIISGNDHNKQVSPAQQCHRVIANYLDLYGFQNNQSALSMDIDTLLRTRFNEAMQQSECKSFDWTYRNSTMPDLSGKILVDYDVDGQRKMQTTFLVGRKLVR